MSSLPSGFDAANADALNQIFKTIIIGD